MGDRSYPWAALVRHSDHGDGMQERGFWLLFENGWTLSVTWGSGSYSVNHFSYLTGKPFTEEVPEAEIAAWPQSGEMVPWADDDTVRGWVTADQLNGLIDAMKSWPSTVPSDFIASLPSQVDG